MAFKSVELGDEDLKSNRRPYEKFIAIGDKHLGVWCRTEKQTKDFGRGKGPQDVNVHVFWRPAKGDQPAGEFEITGSWGLDAAVKKAKEQLGLEDDAGHLVRFTYTHNIKGSNGGDIWAFKAEVDTDYPKNPQAKLPPGLKGGAKSQPPDEDDDIPF
jgi:hypothetical protein